MRFQFEKLPGPIYPAYLHVGEYSIALEPELIDFLKEMTGLEAEPFLTGLIKKIGINRYLRRMMEVEIAQTEDRALLAKQLKEELRGL
ncbi:MAG: hypothetical protein WAO55_16050 [Candidatus Manganitrophaceae bacterium]